MNIDFFGSRIHRISGLSLFDDKIDTKRNAMVHYTLAHFNFYQKTYFEMVYWKYE